MTRKQIAEKIKTLSPKEVIIAMVEGLKNPYTVVQMLTYGKKCGDVCYGCAATNAVMHINKKLSKALLVINSKKEEAIIIRRFERAIDSLRTGNLHRANYLLADLGINPIVNPNRILLPYLTTEDYKTYLYAYELLAEDQ